MAVQRDGSQGKMIRLMGRNLFLKDLQDFLSSPKIL